jgi:hypothetical protein
LQGLQNVVEQNTTKGVPAPSARPTGVLRNPNRPIRAVSIYRSLSDGFSIPLSPWITIPTNTYPFSYHEFISLSLLYKKSLFPVRRFTPACRLKRHKNKFLLPSKLGYMFLNTS